MFNLPNERQPGSTQTSYAGSHPSNLMANGHRSWASQRLAEGTDSAVLDPSQSFSEE